MTFRFKLVLSATVVLLLAAFAGAQSTTYSTANFSATFLGPVRASSPDRNVQNTSTSQYYSSVHNGVEETVSDRTVDHDIPVDQSSLDFYAGGALKDADDDKGKVLDDRQYSTFQGHISVCVNLHFTEQGVVQRRRVCYILAGPRHVFALWQQAAASQDDGGLADWTTFTRSLVIK
jgi:hypothetical protein